MKKFYIEIGLLIILGGASAPVAEAAVNFSAPVSDPGNWTVRFDSPDHTGKDLYAFDLNRDGYSDAGKPVLAAADGVVVRTDNTTSSGGVIYISHADSLESAYLHLDARNFKVKVGDHIQQGQTIGYVADSSENGAHGDGPHLHFAAYNVGSGGHLTAHNLNGDLALDNIRRYNSGGIIARGFNTVKDFFFGKDVGGGAAEPVKLIDPNAIIKRLIGDGVSQFYNWALDIGSMLALGVIIFSGVLYISSAGNPTKRGEAIEWLKAAIYGLAILLGAYPILYTVNPCLVGVGAGCG